MYRILLNYSPLNLLSPISFMNREGGGFTWAKDHNSSFALDKLALTHYTCKRIPDPEHPRKTIPLLAPDLVLKGRTVTLSPLTNTWVYIWTVNSDGPLRQMRP